MRCVFVIFYTRVFLILFVVDASSRLVSYPEFFTDICSFIRRPIGRHKLWMDDKIFVRVTLSTELLFMTNYFFTLLTFLFHFSKF